MYVENEKLRISYSFKERKVIILKKFIFQGIWMAQKGFLRPNTV